MTIPALLAVCTSAAFAVGYLTGWRERAAVRAGVETVMRNMRQAMERVARRRGA